MQLHKVVVEDEDQEGTQLIGNIVMRSDLVTETAITPAACISGLDPNHMKKLTIITKIETISTSTRTLPTIRGTIVK